MNQKHAREQRREIRRSLGEPLKRWYEHEGKRLDALEDQAERLATKSAEHGEATRMLAENTQDLRATLQAQQAIWAQFKDAGFWARLLWLIFGRTAA
jgi:hypothetical protein